MYSKDSCDFLNKDKCSSGRCGCCSFCRERCVQANSPVIVGPMGPQGIAGKPFTYNDFTPEQLEALKGAQGASGADGLNGKSAYEVAVDNGYEGTEQEWLETLVGPAGNSTFLVFNTGDQDALLRINQAEGINQRAAVGSFGVTNFDNATDEVDLSGLEDFNNVITIARSGTIVSVSFHAYCHNIVADVNTSFLATVWINRFNSGDNIFRPIANLNYRGTPLLSPTEIYTSFSVSTLPLVQEVANGDRIMLTIYLSNQLSVASADVRFNATVAISGQ